MPLWTLALLLLAVPARAEKSSATIALERVLELEQNIYPPEQRPAWEKAYAQKVEAAIAPVSSRMKELGIEKKDTPADWLSSWGRGYTWTDALEWTRKLQASSDAARCEIVTLAYLFAVWQVTTIPPEIPINTMEDILVRSYTELGPLWRDRARAAWAFRFIKHTDTYYVPIACRSLKDEADDRYLYINDDDHKPLGFARPMCGRPMNSHWLEPDVEAGKRPEPQGWTKPVD